MDNRRRLSQEIMVGSAHPTELNRDREVAPTKPYTFEDSNRFGFAIAVRFLSGLAIAFPIRSLDHSLDHFPKGTN